MSGSWLETDSDSAAKSNHVQIVVLSKSHFQFSAEHADLLSSKPQVLISPLYGREINWKTTVLNHRITES